MKNGEQIFLEAYKHKENNICHNNHVTPKRTCKLIPINTFLSTYSREDVLANKRKWSRSSSPVVLRERILQWVFKVAKFWFVN